MIANNFSLYLSYLCDNRTPPPIARFATSYNKRHTAPSTETNTQIHKLHTKEHQPKQPINQNETNNVDILLWKLLHVDDCRRSPSLMVPLLLLYMNVLHWSGWKEADVMTSDRSSIFGGLISTIATKWLPVTKKIRIIQVSKSL